MQKPAPLEYGQYYHIYNRGIARASIFLEERNYRYFLQLYARHVGPVARTFAYCLLPNHFHFLVQIKDLTGLEDLSGLKESGQKAPSQRFSNLLNAYAKAFNRAYDRTGALFQRPFGRIAVTSDAYFAALVLYIHHNPQRHGLTDDFRTWPFSSYGALVSPKETQLERDQVLAWFDGTDAFVVAHAEQPDEARIQPLIAEDFA